MVGLKNYITMKFKTTRVTQVLFYLLLIEFILIVVRPDNKPIIGLEIMKWVLIVTAVFFISSVAFFFWKKKNENS